MTFIRIGFTASMVFCALLAAAAVAQEQDQKNDKTSPPVWTVPDINALPDDAAGRLVRHGRDLITMTDAYIGPHAADRDTRFAGSNLACGNCHLEAGTKKFGLPIFGLASDFPRYSARTGADISIEERMNGRPLLCSLPTCKRWLLTSNSSHRESYKASKFQVTARALCPNSIARRTPNMASSSIHAPVWTATIRTDRALREARRQ